MMKVYAAMHDDIAEGFVWLRMEGPPARSIVKITNTNSNRSVFCEALKFESNYLARYNQCPRIKIEDPAASIVMSYWYRAKLGTRDTPLETQKEYPLRITYADSWWKSWWGKVCACWHHPQLVVRVSACLAILSVVLSVVSVGLGAISLWPDAAVATTQAKLSVDDVLRWREVYGDLLGKSRDAVIERLGPAEKVDDKELTWSASPRTGNRSLTVSLTLREKNVVARGVMIKVRPGESLEVLELLRKAPSFHFSTGTSTDTLVNHFFVQSADGGVVFVFAVSENGVAFNGVVFR